MVIKMGKRIEKVLALAIVLLYQFSYSGVASAGPFDWLVNKDADEDPLIVEAMKENRLSHSQDIWQHMKTILETEKEKTELKVLSTHTVRATGYSSTPDQTDDTPFITASGTYVRDGIVAANFSINGRRAPFGTLVRIPEIYGEKIFIVEDRMNSRYTNNLDIWFPERNLAKEFGSKRVVIEVVKES
jgi:3D (Asp-Asp-Asp) domain-containing protein